MVSVQCPFFKKRLVNSSQPLNDYLSLKMLFVPLWYFSTYILSVFALESGILSIVSSCSSLFGQICNVPLSCLLVRNLSQVLSFPVRRWVSVCVCVYAHRHLVCASLVFLCLSPHSSHIGHFVWSSHQSSKTLEFQSLCFFFFWSGSSLFLFFFLLNHLLVLVGLLWVLAVCYHPEHHFFSF